MMKTFWILLLFIVCLSCGEIAAVQENKNVPVSQAIWNSLLKKYVSQEGNVNYKGFIPDSVKLNEYLSLLSNNAPNAKWSEDEQKAYWINAYNAFTVKLILKYYPVKSIKDIGGKIQIPLINSPWDIKFIKIGNSTYDLNNIEHDILRKKYNDPRIHCAIVCASKSCPKLRGEAFAADRLNKQLDEQAIDFINDKTKNKISRNEIKISEIFHWFKGDFTKNGSLIDFLNKYSTIKIDKDAKVSHLNYDWAINE